jgi:cyclic pyranopterin phosphate synthase
MSGLTHLDDDGRPRMVDVSAKPATDREAAAVGRVRMSAAARGLALGGGGRKGDVRAAAQIAAVMAAKRTADLIPLCHPLALTRIEVSIEGGTDGVEVVARVATHGPTGVEMEALTAVSVACLTIYDMLKAVDRGMIIDGVRLVEKRGGASGDWAPA